MIEFGTTVVLTTHNFSCEVRISVVMHSDSGQSPPWCLVQTMRSKFQLQMKFADMVLTCIMHPNLHYAPHRAEANFKFKRLTTALKCIKGFGSKLPSR